MSGRSEHPAPGRVWIIGAGPGAADLLTLRAVRALGSADVVLHDRFVPQEVLAFARPDARRVCVGKRAGEGGTDVAWIGRLMAREARAGATVARVQGGDPSIFGRLSDELELLERAGVRWEIVPGVTAALACAAALGTPLTRRDAAASVLLTAGSNPGAAEAAARHAEATLAFYMAGERAAGIGAALLRAGRDPMTPAALVWGAGLPTQRTWRGTLEGLGRLPAYRAEAPALLLVGDVLAPAMEKDDGRREARSDRSGLPHDVDADPDATRPDGAGRAARGPRGRGQTRD